jgi:ATP-dependent helicase/nuclease subunit B
VPGLRIVYGERLDGVAWPPSPESGSLGFAVVGPAGLLALVETFAGLSGPPVAAARRIALMRRRLSVLPDRPRFWSASFAIDPWAVAREVLKWRDELVEAGWSAATIAKPPARLAELAELESLVEPPILPGRADRLVMAVGALEGGIDLPFKEIVVIDPSETVGPGIKRLLKAIADRGVQVSYQPAGAGLCRQGTDLARVQSWLASGQAEPLVGDGTFVVLQGRSEGAEAEAVADWLAASPADPETVVILGAASGMLDGALARRGLPRFAHLPASPLRGAVQLLALAFAIRWRPFDPAPLLDLLSLPQSPVPAAVARALAAALTEAPGRDGPRWVEAIETGRQRRRERFEKEGLSEADLERRVRRDTERWLPWLNGDLFDELPGIPVAVARDICGRVAAWSALVAAGGQGPVAAVGGFATTLSLVIAEAGLDPVPRVQLERMIDAVIADGVDAEHAAAEAGPWSHVFHPAQIWDEAGTVLWWGFGSDSTPRHPQIWTDEEKAALRAAGCLPDDPAAALARESAGWRRAVLKACDRVLLVPPPGADGEESAHPLLHELAPLLSQASHGVSFDAERIFEVERIELAGRQIGRAVAASRPLPEPRRSWSVAVGAIKPRSVDAATSIGLLLACPFAWSLQYAGKLRPSRRSEVPQGETLLGLLAHALAAEIFQPGSPPQPEHARQLAQERLPALVDEMASPLRLPGAAADYARALSRLPVAMETLARGLADLGATVIGAEVERDAADALAPGVALNGRLDLLVGAATGEPAVLDMKWSRTDRYRREEIQQGHSVQLAVYGRILGTEGAPAPGAYFMLSQARLLPAGDNLFGPSGGSGAPGLAEVWSNTQASWQARMDHLDGGRVAALSEDLAGIGDDAGDGAVPLQLTPPCRFCDKTRLCGHARVL